MKSLTTYDPTKNKYVKCGDYEGDTLIRHVNSKHFMRVLNGYGIQEVAFTKLVELGIKYIILIVDSNKIQWNSTTKDWLEHGKVANYGHGSQRFLSLKYMHSKKVVTENAQNEKAEPTIEKNEDVDLIKVLASMPVDEKNDLRAKLGLKRV